MTRPFKPVTLSPLGDDTGAAEGFSPATSVAPTFGDPPNFIELGYGTGPRCIQCRRNVSGCQCDAAEPEPEYFQPAINRDVDWHLVDRIAPLPAGWNRVEL